MRENFVIREERHPLGKKLIDVLCLLIAILWPVGMFAGASQEDYYFGQFLFNLTLFWQVICLIAWVVIVLCSREEFLCGFHVDGCRVKLEGRDVFLTRKFTFTVNNREYSVNRGKVEDLDIQMPADIKKGICWYACATFDGGHELVLVSETLESTGFYILIDGVVVVEDGFVYVDKIREILSGTVAASTQAPHAIDTGVMPPFQTFPSHSNEEKTVAPRTKRYAIVGETGTFANHQFNITDMLVLGRDAAECRVVFPSDTVGVSRVHCKLVVEADGLYVYDLGSTYGTVVNNNKTISANQKMKLNHGDTITIGSNQTFVVKEI